MIRLLPFDYSARNLGRSRLRLGLSVFGAALVVLLVLAAASFVRGMERSLRASGGQRNMIILGAGSEESVERSEITAGAASLVGAAVPGIAQRAGVAYLSPEVHVGLPLTPNPDKKTGSLVLVRGVTPAALLVHDQVQIVEGRFPNAGVDEVMVGDRVADKMGVPGDRVAVGGTLYLDRRPWTIVGRFVAPGSVMESEAWAPLTDLKIATKRDTDSCIVLTLGTAEAADVDLFCKQRLDLELVAMSETRYYAGLSAFYRPIRAVAWTTAVLIGVGGLLGGLNTMYAAFASRTRELGMLQCLGFRRAAIIVSLVQESLLASAAGAIIPCAVGIPLLDGVSVRFSMGAFGLHADAPAVSLALLAGLVLGLVGALPPAWRALRLPIPQALKAA